MGRIIREAVHAAEPPSFSILSAAKDFPAPDEFAPAWPGIIVTSFEHLIEDQHGISCIRVVRV